MGRWTERLKARLEEVEDAIVSHPDSHEIPEISLSEFARCNIALKIHLSVLNCLVWFCPDEQMVEEVLEDDPIAICYTGQELKELINIDPSEDFLRKIHVVKSVFNYSRLKK